MPLYSFFLFSIKVWFLSEIKICLLLIPSRAMRTEACCSIGASIVILIVPFVYCHRFEPDMLAFSGCYYGGGEKERRELGKIRRRWKTLHVRL